MGPHKIAKLLKAKGSVNRANGNHHIRKKIFTNSTSDRGLISNIYEELKKLDSRELNNPIKIAVQS
jgi:CRISPR/Cas system endoribonuclease Cas6 (RAMP superfamily)